MAEKPKKKAAKSKPEDKGVLGGLPSTRAERIGTRRPAAGQPPAAPRAKATRRKAAAPRTFEPTAAAEEAAGAADERAAGVPPEAAAELPEQPEPSYPRPRPVSEGAPGIGTTGYRGEPSAGPAESGRPSAPELAATAVQAAGQVVQLSLSIGGRLLKQMAGRLPRP
jgi:hypothetical protein